MLNFHNSTPSILVIGDLILDVYLWGKCERISPEAPVQVVDVKQETISLGGAGNVLENLISLGAKAEILSVIGSCSNASDIKKIFAEKNINTEFLFNDKTRVTSKKTRLISSNQQVIRFDSESTEPINSTIESKIISKLEDIIRNYSIVIISDYLKGLLTFSLTQNIIKICNKYSTKVIVDPKGDDYSKYKGSYLLTPNLMEAKLASNIDICDDKDLQKSLSYMRENLNLSESIVTLSERGIAFLKNSKVKIFPSCVRDVYDVTGAGDTVIASIAYVLANNYNIEEAIKFANMAAGVVVGKLGSATVTISEIMSYSSEITKPTSANKISQLNDLKTFIKKHKSQNEKIVFTNGCFDIIHTGHIKYLEKAKSLGDILVVGINSDLSVKKLKGPQRPINNQNDRSEIIAALDCVDYVVIFNEQTPEKLLSEIRPSILVKGGDYKKEEVVGSEYVKDVVIAEFIQGKSSSNIIEKIKTT